MLYDAPVRVRRLEQERDEYRERLNKARALRIVDTVHIVNSARRRGRAFAQILNITKSYEGPAREETVQVFEAPFTQRCKDVHVELKAPDACAQESAYDTLATTLVRGFTYPPNAPTLTARASFIRRRLLPLPYAHSSVLRRVAFVAADLNQSWPDSRTH